MNFLERLNKYMEDNKLRQIDLAQKCNMNKSYISGVLSDKRTPNIEFLTALSNMSGKSINWWLYGTEQRENLAALNELIELFMANGDIKEDGTYDDDTFEMLRTMMNKEIKVKAQNKKA
ncbi:helix-turn-helix domain-containing protein [Clostridium beijerinckii]|uniref:Helix-turn-helix transcriptional regulator n=1 Tax=Clostridium beijerinckii TaxID=1520 RepID=A0A7X9SQQ9_CLOBE|nr:helix-turn-helix transcriptional regulator [Clostridium beijerinckii]NMF06299.1 helix-turn-helix transcriptional regulator [Clostridium beijerinckii]